MNVLASSDVSVVIPTYGRGRMLVDTLCSLATQSAVSEIIVVDQTLLHDPETEVRLAAWARAERNRWIRRPTPSITGAMNDGLVAARGEWVLFLDDDIVPSAELVAAHTAAATSHREAWAVVGQVLQPRESPEYGTERQDLTSLCQDLDFKFNSTTPGWVTNVMAGNLCVKRERALALGGFDENFGPPVAFRFETEFAKRVIRNGGKIWFEPKASIRHLRAPSGGTRSQGSHLVSASPVHGVGDYYYALRCGKGWERFLYMARRPFREVRTRFHLKHPWYIPVKLVGELRALFQALNLYRQAPKLIRHV
jgi:GT2 family glycosyltransferase